MWYLRTIQEQGIETYLLASRSSILPNDAVIEILVSWNTLYVRVFGVANQNWEFRRKSSSGDRQVKKKIILTTPSIYVELLWFNIYSTDRGRVSGMFGVKLFFSQHFSFTRSLLVTRNLEKYFYCTRL